MTGRRRRFTAEFKKRVALKAVRGDSTVQALAAKHEVHPSQVASWKKQATDGLGEVFSSARKSGSGQDALVKELYAKIGELTVERTFSARAGALSRSARLAMVEREGPLSLSRHCELLGVGRAALYREPAGESEANLVPATSHREHGRRIDVPRLSRS